jgi:hypothetical protein
VWEEGGSAGKNEARDCKLTTIVSSRDPERVQPKPHSTEGIDECPRNTLIARLPPFSPILPRIGEVHRNVNFSET